MDVKSNRTLNSNDVQAIMNHQVLGLGFPCSSKRPMTRESIYYIGDAKPIATSFKQTTIENDKGQQLPVVELHFNLDHPVEDSMYNYLSQE